MRGHIIQRETPTLHPQHMRNHIHTTCWGTNGWEQGIQVEGVEVNEEVVSMGLVEKGAKGGGNVRHKVQGSVNESAQEKVNESAQGKVIHRALVRVNEKLSVNENA